MGTKDIRIEVTALADRAAVAAFVPGYRQHCDKRIPPLAAFGLCLVISAAAGGETGPSDSGEIVLTLLGGASLILAHVLNRNFCRRCRACATYALGPGRT